MTEQVDNILIVDDEPGANSGFGRDLEDKGAINE